MGFFSAVGQVISNQKTFKQWEKDDANKQKQRDELAKNGISQAELQYAANKGKVIMDVVDIMDTHSEEVAENTETAIMPIAQTLPSLVTLLSILGTAKFYMYPKANAYDKAYEGFINSNSGKELNDIIVKLKENIKNSPQNNPLNEIKIGAPNLISGLFGKKLTEIPDERIKTSLPEAIFSKKNMAAISKSNNKEVKALQTRLGELAKEFHNTKGLKNNSMGKILGKSAGLIAGISALTFVAANIIAAKIQVKSSRIARWQSREDLSDPKYFVQYTDKQIEEAQKNVDAGKKDEKKGFSLFKKKDNAKDGLKHSNNNSFFKSLGATIKDNKNYNEWKENYNLEDKKVKRNLTPDELKEAEKEQEVIQRVTKIINNKAEEYSENMETTAGVLIGGTPYLGLAIGAIINTIVTKTGLGDKISDKKFNNLLKQVTDNDKKEELKTLYNKIKAGTKDKADKSFVGMVDGVNNFKQYFSKMIEATSTFESKKGLNAAFTSMKDMLNVAMTTKAARNTLVGFAGSLITGIVGAFMGLKLQKSAARAGRYKAKRELEQNSENFIGYTKEEFNSVNNIKAGKKPALQKLGEYLTFIPRVIKDYFNYEKYRKTEAENDRALLGELIKLDVTDKQLQEAKELQRKLFTTFESVDDKSQEYSEAIEAVTEMSQPLLPYIGMALAAIPIVIGGTKLVKKGSAGTVESITGFFAKHTRFLKGKTANKYVDGVANNIRGIVERQDTSKNNDPVIKFYNSLAKGDNRANLSQAIKNAIQSAKGEENELKAFLNIIADYPALKKPLNKAELEKAFDIMLNQGTPIIMEKLSGEGANTQINTQQYTKGLKEHLAPFLDGAENLSDIFKKILSEIEIPNVKISDITNGTNILSTFGIKGIGQFKQNIKSNNVTGVANAVIEGKIQTGEWRKYLNTLQDGMENGGLKTLLNKLSNSRMTDKQALTIYQNIQTILKNMPKEELGKIMDVVFEEFIKNPDKFMQALQNGQFKTILVTKGLAITAVASPVVWSALTMLITFAVESMFASMQKQAGRLGVMKALEELEDVKFYANMEPSLNGNNSKEKTAPASIMTNTKSVNDLFNSLIKK